MHNIKVIATAAIVVLICVSCFKIYRAGYEKGAASELIKHNINLESERELMLKNYSIELNKKKADAEKWKNYAIKLQNQPVKQVTKYVKEIQKNSNCVNLGDKFRIMHNNFAKQLTARKPVN